MVCVCMYARNVCICTCMYYATICMHIYGCIHKHMYMTYLERYVRKWFTLVDSREEYSGYSFILLNFFP